MNFVNDRILLTFAFGMFKFKLYALCTNLRALTDILKLFLSVVQIDLSK